MTPTPPSSTSPTATPTASSGWTLAELLVVTAIFAMASVTLFSLFDDQAAYATRTTIESLQNGLRDAMVREMTERAGNGYVLIESGRQGFAYVQGGQYPYRLSTTDAAGTLANDNAGAGTTSFALKVEKLVAGSYQTVSSLTSEGLSLVYHPEGRAENTAVIATAPPTPPAFATTVVRTNLGTRTVFYLQKGGKPVSNRVEFAFFAPRNVNADPTSDVTSDLSSGGNPVTQVRLTVSLLGNLSASNNLNTNATTLQLRRSGSAIGIPVTVPDDLR